jgi:hypothetical protein
MKKLLIILLFSSMGFLFIGCSAKGPQFQSFEKPKNSNNGMLYVYRKAQLFGDALTYSVFAGNYYIGTMKINGYANKEIPAGIIKIYASTTTFDKGSLLVNVPKNGIVCVKTYPGLGLSLIHI